MAMKAVIVLDLVQHNQVKNQKLLRTIFDGQRDRIKNVNAFIVDEQTAKELKHSLLYSNDDKFLDKTNYQQDDFLF